MNILQSRAAVAIVASICGTASGVVGGFLANKWSWGVLSGTLVLIAVAAALEGHKATSAQPTPPEPEPEPEPQDQDQAPASAGATVTVSTGNVGRRGQVIGAGGNVDNSRTTNIRSGGGLTLIIAVVVLLLVFSGTALLATSNGGRLSGSEPTTETSPGTASTGAASSRPSASASPVPSSPPRVKLPGDRYEGEVSTKDGLGYTLSIRWSMSIGTPSKVIENSPPGQTEIAIPVEASVVQTNTTQGRNYNFSGDGFAVGGLYPMGTKVCRYTDVLASTVDISLSRPKGKYCWLPFAEGDSLHGSGASDSQLGEGEAHTVQLKATLARDLSTDNQSDTTAMIKYVAEKDYDDVVEELGRPLMWTLNSKITPQGDICEVGPTVYDAIIDSSATLPRC